MGQSDSYSVSRNYIYDLWLRKQFITLLINIWAFGDFYQALTNTINNDADLRSNLALDQ